MGTGRCGTMSMAALLNSQPGLNITHERNRMAWQPDQIALGMTLERLKRREELTVGDCGFWYLSYVKLISHYQYMGKRFFVCLRRDKAQTIDSYMRKTPHTNNWTIKGSKYFNEKELSGEWYRCYPNYDLPKEKAISRYYDDYYLNAEKLSNKIPNFKIFDMDIVLNTKDGQRELFKFLDIDGIPNIWMRFNRSRYK